MLIIHAVLNDKRGDKGQSLSRKAVVGSSRGRRAAGSRSSWKCIYRMECIRRAPSSNSEYSSATLLLTNITRRLFSFPQEESYLQLLLQTQLVLLQQDSILLTSTRKMNNKKQSHTGAFPSKKKQSKRESSSILLNDLKTSQRNKNAKRSFAFKEEEFGNSSLG